MKTFISIVGFVGLVVFLILWLLSSSNLSDSQKEVTNLRNQVADLESKSSKLQNDLNQANTDLSQSKSALNTSSSDLQNKESEVTRLTQDNDLLKRNLSDSETALNKLKADQAKAAEENATIKDAHEDFLNQIGTLTAQVTAVTQERDQLKNQLDQAEKTLEAFRTAQ
ncbi:MAG: hypothetical protein LBF38_08825 [Deltaproteobacteria bacterium]|jgi:chromosome segregation ATPase|nr:hypothetical protein [Deltaproteobacteria bacterium]